MAVIAAAMLLLLASCSSGNERTLDYYDDAPTGDAAVGTDGYFVDPQGTYELEIDPNWERAYDLAPPDVVVWLVPDPEDDVRHNVIVGTDPAFGESLDEYMETSIQASARLIEGLEIINTSIVHRESKPDLGVLEVLANGSHGLSLFFIHKGQAVTVTLTASLDRFEEIRLVVEPYLLTVKPLGS